MENYAKREVDIHGNARYYNSKGQLHREDGPAVEWVNGDKHWFINGKRHRLDGPAAEWFTENKIWYLKSKIYIKHYHNILVLFYILEPRRIDLNPE